FRQGNAHRVNSFFARFFPALSQYRKGEYSPARFTVLVSHPPGSPKLKQVRLWKDVLAPAVARAHLPYSLVAALPPIAVANRLCVTLLAAGRHSGFRYAPDVLAHLAGNNIAALSQGALLYLALHATGQLLERLFNLF